MSNPLGNPFATGGRHTPGVEPSPNSEPVGALAGAPPRTRLYQRNITAEAEQIVDGTAENRIVTLVAPLVGWSIYVGDQSVSAKIGVQLPVGQPYSIPLSGLQALYAVTDAPINIPLQIQVSIILFAERQRIVGR